MSLIKHNRATNKTFKASVRPSLDLKSCPRYSIQQSKHDRSARYDGMRLLWSYREMALAAAAACSAGKLVNNCTVQS